MMVLKIFEKIIQTYMEFLKEINVRRNVLEQKLYASSKNEQLFQMMRIQKAWCILLRRYAAMKCC
jgi:magnesium transporter